MAEPGLAHVDFYFIFIYLFIIINYNIKKKQKNPKKFQNILKKNL